VVDFDDYPTNTVITTQYPGVTFSVVGSPTCTSVARIVQPAEGCSSPSRALRVDGVGEVPCEFHPQWLRMQFDPPVHYVTFTIGPGNAEWFQDYQIEAYDTSSGAGSLLDLVLVTDAGNGVFHHVTAQSGSDIRRIDVKGMAGASLAGWECIDDLQYRFDMTPPEVQISSPSFAECICGPFQILGRACDDVSTYASDRLEYRPAGGGSWTLVQQFTASPVCIPDSWMYNVDPDALGLTHGWYYFRVTAENVCGLAASDMVAVYIDESFGTAQINSPTAGETICGMVEIEGTAWEKCFERYTVEYVPLGGQVFMPVDPMNPEYYVPKAHDCMLAMWNTTMVPDGDYIVRLVGFDVCGNPGIHDMIVTVDNSVPCGCPADINGDGMVGSDDLLMLILSWGSCMP
ncbi:MAG: hypothetical protein ACYTGC_00350, partial [Planctomycetota bacterium]